MLLCKGSLEQAKSKYILSWHSNKLHSKKLQLRAAGYFSFFLSQPHFFFSFPLFPVPFPVVTCHYRAIIEKTSLLLIAFHYHSFKWEKERPIFVLRIMNSNRFFLRALACSWDFPAASIGLVLYHQLHYNKLSCRCSQGNMFKKRRLKGYIHNRCCLPPLPGKELRNTQSQHYSWEKPQIASVAKCAFLYFWRPSVQSKKLPLVPS